MNCKRFALATVIGFIFVFIYEYVVHNILLVPTYELTPQLWRPPEDMGNYIPFMIAMQISITAVLCFIYTRHHQGKGIGEGLRFGAMFGALLGLGMLASYAWMPISLGLALSWFAVCFIKTLILGVIFSLLYKD